MKTSPFATLLLLALCSCGSPSTPDGKTSTKLDAVEVQPGTISDSMIILDDSSTDGTAVDNSDPDAKNGADSDAKAKPPRADATDGEASTGDSGARITDPAPTPKKMEPAKN